jgi:hypothetical protein
MSMKFFRYARLSALVLLLILAGCEGGDGAAAKIKARAGILDLSDGIFPRMEMSASTGSGLFTGTS